MKSRKEMTSEELQAQIYSDLMDMIEAACDAGLMNNEATRQKLADDVSSYVEDLEKELGYLPAFFSAEDDDEEDDIAPLIHMWGLSDVRGIGGGMN